MEETPEEIIAKQLVLVVEPVEPQLAVNHMLVAIDSAVAGISIVVSLVYIILVIFSIFFTKSYFFNRQSQIHICLVIAALNFFRVGLNFDFIPMFLGCMWLLNANYTYFVMKHFEQTQSRDIEIELEIVRIQDEIAALNRPSLPPVWPPNPTNPT